MSDTQKDKTSVPCPECDTPIVTPEDLEVGKIIECPTCGIESECIELNPLKFAPLEEEK